MIADASLEAPINDSGAFSSGIPELLGRTEVARFLSCRLEEVERIAGPASCVVKMPCGERQAWLSGFVQAEIRTPANYEPDVFYTLRGIIRLYDSVRWRVEKLVGEPDAILVEGKTSTQLYSSASVFAGLELLTDVRKKGETVFDRERPFRRRVSAKKRRTADRRSSAFFALASRPTRKGRICQALHRAADNLTYQRANWRK